MNEARLRMRHTPGGVERALKLKGLLQYTELVFPVSSDFSRFQWESLAIIRVSEYRVWTGDNPSFRIYNRKKTHALLRLANVVSSFLYMRGLYTWMMHTWMAHFNETRLYICMRNVYTYEWGTSLNEARLYIWMRHTWTRNNWMRQVSTYAWGTSIHVNEARLKLRHAFTYERGPFERGLLCMRHVSQVTLTHGLLLLWSSLRECVAECCSVLQCAAVCCSVLQCVAVCCSV